MAVRTIIRLNPPRPRLGTLVDVQATIAHPMETGFRRDDDGVLAARDIVRRFRATLDGVEVFAAQLHPGVAANPYIAFSLRVQGPASLRLEWSGDNGFAHAEVLAVQPA